MFLSSIKTLHERIRRTSYAFCHLPFIGSPMSSVTRPVLDCLFDAFYFLLISCPLPLSPYDIGRDERRVLCSAPMSIKRLLLWGPSLLSFFHVTKAAVDTSVFPADFAWGAGMTCCRLHAKSLLTKPWAFDDESCFYEKGSSPCPIVDKWSEFDLSSILFEACAILTNYWCLDSFLKPLRHTKSREV